MPDCYYCGERIESTNPYSGPKRRFCSTRCRKAYQKETGYESSHLGGSMKARKARLALIERARYGDKEAQDTLRKEGLRGLWNPKEQKMVRW